MDTRRVRIALVGAVLGLLLGTRPSVRAAEETKQGPCCFANKRYSGLCQVEPSEGETCSSILGYLNNPSSSGKSYCGNTDVRQGWTRTTCK